MCLALSVFQGCSMYGVCRRTVVSRHKCKERSLLLFGLDPPRAGERQPGERAARAAPEPEEEDSYAALVKELGY